MYFQKPCVNTKLDTSKYLGEKENHKLSLYLHGIDFKIAKQIEISKAKLNVISKCIFKVSEIIVIDRIHLDTLNMKRKITSYQQRN